MLTLKFYTAIGDKEIHQAVQVVGYVIERNVKTNEIVVYGTNDRGERIPSQIWTMSYLHEGELVLARGCVYVMNESGKTIDKYDISDWQIFREAVERCRVKKLAEEIEEYPDDELPLVPDLIDENDPEYVAPLDSDFGLGKSGCGSA